MALSGVDKRYLDATLEDFKKRQPPLDKIKLGEIISVEAKKLNGTDQGDIKKWFDDNDLPFTSRRGEHHGQGADDMDH